MTGRTGRSTDAATATGAYEDGEQLDRAVLRSRSEVWRLTYKKLTGSAAATRPGVGQSWHIALLDVGLFPLYRQRE